MSAKKKKNPLRLNCYEKYTSQIDLNDIFQNQQYCFLSPIWQKKNAYII